MQDALRFLEAVLPAHGLRVVAHRKRVEDKPLLHDFVATNDELIARTMALDSAGKPTWVGMATFADPKIGRKGINTVALQSFYVDLDFHDYDSPELARADIVRLYDSVGHPSITVFSGGGLHLYWVLRAPLPTDEWKPIASAFKAHWQSLGIKADPAVTADMARVLRLPGTHNRKSEYGTPREVAIEEFTDLTYDAQGFARKIAAATPKVKPRIPATVRARPTAPGLNDDLISRGEHQKSYIQFLLPKCLQMQALWRDRATLSEPKWFKALGLLRHLENGRALAHVFSKDHPGYTVEETDAKLAQLEEKDIGPTTCAAFKSENPAGCEGCPYNITSPILLGHEEVQAVEPVVQVTEHTVTAAGEATVIQRVEHPDVSIPKGYKYDGQSLMRSVQDEQTGLWRDEVIFKGFLCPERLSINTRGDSYSEIRVYVHAVGQEARRITIPAKVMSDKRDFSRELHSKGVMFMPKNASHLLDLVHRMADEVNEKRLASKVADQMGWQDDGMFVVGATGYRANKSPLFDLPVPANIRSTLRYYEPTGSLDAWRRTTAVYNRPGAEAYQFALCYGASGVFLPITKLTGIVLSLYSRDAGRGKSTVGFGALSWWGDPNGLKSQSKDTNNALFNKASSHKNLPILMDEITDKTAQDLEDLVYYMAEGREKARLNSDSSPRAILPGWALPVIATSNNSILSKLHVRRGDTQGLFARVIEVPMDLPFAIEMGYTDRMQLRNGFVDNYGHAGPALVRYAMENPDLCASIIDSLSVKLDAVVGGDSAYRFWVASCASTLAVATVARKLGLISYDITALAKWTADLLRSQLAESEANLATSADVLGQFLERNTNRIIVSFTVQVGAGVAAPRIWPEDGVYGNQLVGRVESTSRSLFVSLSAFVRFCQDTGFDMNSFVREAVNTVDPDSGEPLLKRAAPVQVNLGRGTRIASARVKALEFNLLHPALREFAMGIDSKITAAGNIRSVK